MGVTKDIVSFVMSTQFTDFPYEVIQESKLCLLDWIGVGIAGSREPGTEILLKVFSTKGSKNIFGHKRKTDMFVASLINGAASHILDYDDVNMIFLGHLSAVLFPAILAVSEGEEFLGRDILTAFIVGYEVAVRVSLAATISHYKIGWHTTSTIGHFASVIASAKLLGLNEKQLLNAIGIAGTQACGTQQSFGTMCKSFHAGNAAKNGLLAAVLAKEGFTGSIDFIEGDKGFLKIYTRDACPEKAIKDWKSKWYILQNQYKLYPSCFQTHASIKSMQKIMENDYINYGNVKSIKIWVNPVTSKVASNPKPKTGTEAKFSIEYCVSNILLKNQVTEKIFLRNRIEDRTISKIMEKILIVPSELYNLDEALVSVELFNGRVLKKQVKMSEIEIDYNEKRKNIESKFLSIALPIISLEKAKKIVEIVNEVDKLENIDKLIENFN